MNENNFVTDLSARLSAIMVQIPKYRARFGAIQWPGSSRFPADESWSEAAERRLAPDLQKLLEAKDN